MAISATIKDTPVHIGDLIKVHHKILEGEKERIQVFEGLLIGIRGRDRDRMFTVRKIATGGIGVEKIFPINSPWLAKIEIKKSAGNVRRAKLNYVRIQSARQVAQISVAQTEK